MTLPRTVMLLWSLAMLQIGCTSEERKITASIGEDVLLPCICSVTTEQVSWQIDRIVVNHYKHSVTTTEKESTHDLYKNRSRLFLSSEKGNCTLLLLKVSPIDQNIFTCYTFDRDSMNVNYVNLMVTHLTHNLPYTSGEVPHVSTDVSSKPGFGDTQVHEGYSVGVPVSLVVLIILAGGIIGVLLLKKRRQNLQNMVFEDSLTGHPIMKPYSV